MSISKLRGKSAIAVQNDNNNNTSYSNNSKLLKSYVPSTTTSLLKIEPFVPTFSTRFRKPIYRSYSTLSSSYFKRINDQKHHHRIGRFPERGLLQHQRSKSTLSSSTKNTHNGVCRVIRPAEDQERLPDRINYDRRGLTAIPIFENEQNLRLLSLQHNLINVFHIPDSSVTQKTKSDCEASGNENEKTLLTNTENNTPAKSQKDEMPPLLVVSTNLLPNGPGSVTNSNTISVPTNSLKPPSPNPLSPNTLTKYSFVKKSVLLHAHQRYGTLQKSRSFMNQYPHPTIAPTKYNTPKCSPLVRTGIAASVGNVTSFGGDTSPTPLLDQEEAKTSTVNDFQTLKVKNNQLSPSYGNIFENLVFLDLYDNQIEKISNLDGLKNLTVLLLGKNRISEVTGLISLKNTLRVLDLHGNKISNISNKINYLKQLKSLNLAGNQIRQINHNDFTGMTNLKELNLKRNRIKRVYGFNHLLNLERLWLCHNDIHRVDDMYSIGDATNLQEVTIENNPVSLAGDCVSFLVSYLPNLVMLSQMPITDQVRTAAMAWRKNKELTSLNQSHQNLDLNGTCRREEVISNARTNWELLRSQQVVTATPNKNSSTNKKPNSNSSQTVSTEPDKAQLQEVGRTSKHIPTRSKTNRPKTGTDKRKRHKSRDTRNETPELLDFFRLPPIRQYPGSNSKTPSEKTHSSGSSLGPNIDSSSSCYTSDDNEESRIVNVNAQRNLETINIHVPQVNEQPQDCEGGSKNTNPKNLDEKVKVLDELPSPAGKPTEEITAVTCRVEIPAVDTSAEPDRNKDTNETPCTESTITSQSDVNSNLSTSSMKTESDLSSPHVNQVEKVTKARVANTANRRYAHGPLLRSQTTRARSTTISNNQLPHHNNAANAANNSGSSAAGATAKTTKPLIEREREQGGDYLIEICGRYLNVYGLGALRFIDKQWNAQKASDVHTLNFSYVNFNNIASILGRIKFRFPNAESFVFRETNINALGQLNALAELQGITSLVIDPEGNPIYEKEWRVYAIYRLSHWGLKTINGTEITEADIEHANKEYLGLSELVLWSLPETLLQPLLARLRLDENCSASKLSAKDWLMKADQSLKVVVGKEALQWKKPMPTPTSINTSNQQNLDHENSLRERGKAQLSVMIENTCNAVEKLQKLETVWPSLLLDIVRNTLLDYSQIDVYVKKLMANIIMKRGKQ